MLPRKLEKALNLKKQNTALDMAAGFIIGAAATALFFITKDGKKSLKANEKSRRSSRGGDACDDFCTCDEPHSDYERARNGCDCHGADEEGDAAILHSHGCLGYPHDDYYGFADSNGDRPSDLSNPEIELSDASYSPAAVKNGHGKSNPQPENKITEVKKK